MTAVMVADAVGASTTDYIRLSRRGGEFASPNVAAPRSPTHLS